MEESSHAVSCPTFLSFVSLMSLMTLMRLMALKILRNEKTVLGTEDLKPSSPCVSGAVPVCLWLMTSLETFLPRLKKSRFFLPLLVALLGFGLGVGISSLPPFRVLELKSLDLRFRLGSHPERADTSVVLVDIDQNSLDFYSRQGNPWPWPREFYALLLDYLHAAEARTVSFDFDFSSPGIDRLEVDGAASDQEFANAIGRSQNVVLGTNLSIREHGDESGGQIDRRFVDPSFAAPPSTTVYDRATAPLSIFQASAARVGVTNFREDEDGIARRMQVVYPFTSGSLLQFSAAAYAVASGIPVAESRDLASRIPQDPSGHMLIYWYGKGGPDGVFRYYSAHALIHSSMKMRQGISPDLPLALFKGKHVIVGGSAAGLWDLKPTPFTSEQQYPGMEIQATILSNLLNRHFIREPSSWVTLFSTIAGVLIVAALFFRIRRVATASALVTLFGLVFLLGAFLLFRVGPYWMNIVQPLSAMAMTFVLAATVSYAVEGQQKRRLRKAFNRYMSPVVVTEILENVDQIELGGKAIEATVFFSDIKNFTTISEQHAPRELVAYLNQYFSLTSELILKNEAMLDKYIGDAIMAIFGAPIPRPDHATIACLTALEVQEALQKEFHDPNRDPHKPIFETRIGLHSGNMIVGNIGSNDRLDYTAIGDTVNLASRLEGTNKMFGSHIIISETTYDQARSAIEARPLDFIRVKGKTKPIRIFELLAKRGELPDDALKRVRAFEEGVELYRTRKFRDALTIFQEIQKTSPDDVPASLYVKRCSEIAGQDLPPEWDGVYVMTTK
jgi:adenylate cyclase